MPLLEELNYDPATTNATEVEDQIKAGLLPAEGFHHAVLDGFREGTATQSGNKFRELTFKIIAGVYKGREVKESLYSTEKTKNRVLIFAHRLGVLKKVNDKFVPIEGKSDFSDVLGAQCVIEVKHEPDQYKDEKTGAMKNVTRVKLSFEGVLSVDDPRCKDVPKANAKSLETAKKAAAEKPKDDFSDI